MDSRADIAVADLVRYYGCVYRERMQDLPIVNERLDVEAVAFTDLDDHRLGVLITPWFMNLVILPGNDEWHDSPQGATATITLPDGNYDFTVSRDDTLGVYLTAVLFRTVADFPDQMTARAIAGEIVNELLTARDVPQEANATQTMNRRAFLTSARPD